MNVNIFNVLGVLSTFYLGVMTEKDNDPAMVFWLIAMVIFFILGTIQW